ncbi:MAG: cyclase family protein [Gaiellales bacterium]
MRVIDLSQPLGPDTPPFPGFAPLRADVEATVADDGYFVRRIDLGEHYGTHFDAPAHFHAGGATVEGIAAERLVRPARVVDVAEQAAADPDYAVTADDLVAMEAAHGALEPGDALVVRTGWDRHLDDPARYVGDLRFPGVGVEAAELAIERGVDGIAIDTLSVDRGIATDFAVHYRTLPAGLWQAEGLVGLERLPARGAWLVVGVPPVVGASGFPARILALIP